MVHIETHAVKERQVINENDYFVKVALMAVVFNPHEARILNEKKIFNE
jgi:hypothetical protein